MFDIIAWMSEHGHPGYASEIEALRSQKAEISAEAGENGHLCPFTARALEACDKAIAEIKQEAQDRYDDWASDPL